MLTVALCCWGLLCIIQQPLGSPHPPFHALLCLLSWPGKMGSGCIADASWHDPQGVVASRIKHVLARIEFTGWRFTGCQHVPSWQRQMAAAAATTNGGSCRNPERQEWPICTSTDEALCYVYATRLFTYGMPFDMHSKLSPGPSLFLMYALVA